MIFKRKQTIGSRRVLRVDQSKSPSSYAYHANRDPRSDQARHELQADNEQVARVGKKKHHIFANMLTLFIIVLIIVFFVNAAWLSENPKVSIVQTSYPIVPLQNTSVYQQAAEKAMATSVGDRNKLTINTSAIDQSLENEFPEIANVTITLPIGGHQPTFYFQPAEPILLISNGPQIYALDANGKAIASEASNATSLEYLDMRVITDPGLGLLGVNHQLLSSNDVYFVQFVMGELKTQGIPISAINFVPNSRELDVYIQAKPYYVKFNLQDDPKEQVGTYIAVEQHLVQANITPAQYIDVRVAGRAYYK